MNQVCLFRKTLLSKSLGNSRRLISSSSTCRQASQQQASTAKDDARAAKMSRKFEPSKSFAMNMFRGKVVGDSIFPFPTPLNDDQKETLSMLVDAFSKLSEKNDPAWNDANYDFPPEIVEMLKESGAFGIQVPEKYGGIGLNNTQYARLVEIMGGNDLAMSIYLGAHQSIGYKGILLYGTDAQKEKYLPDLAAGNNIAAYCLTEPASGSDASSIRTRAVLDSSGKHYVLNGSKIWISNGGFAEVMTVFAQTAVKDEKTGKEKDAITAFIVERKFGGVTNGPPEKKMGIRASNTAEVYYENVKVPVENVLGGVGNGFKVAMNILNNGRFGMAAGMSGTMKYAIQKSAEFATQRTQFGSKIMDYGSIQEKIARMAMRQYVTESMAYHIAGIMDLGFADYQVEAAISKIYGSESAWYVVDEAIQVHGGMGFMAETGLERVLRDLRIFRIFEGANDILRLFVSLTGMQYAGSSLRELQAAMKNPAGNVGLLLGEASRRAMRAVGLSGGGTAENLLQLVDPRLKGSASLAAKSIDNFGNAIEWALMKHGKNVLHQQFLLQRIGYAAMDIYGMVASLSRLSQTMKDFPDSPTLAHEEKLVKGFCVLASDNCDALLREARRKANMETFDIMKSISNDVCENLSTVARHPVGN